MNTQNDSEQINLSFREIIEKINEESSNKKSGDYVHIPIDVSKEKFDYIAKTFYGLEESDKEFIISRCKALCIDDDQIDNILNDIYNCVG